RAKWLRRSWRSARYRPAPKSALAWRRPNEDEIGRKVRALPCLVIGVERDKKRVLFWDLGDTEVKADDLMLVIEGPAAEERK
ncbi:MAG TPA: hypothetical protein VIH23_06415, partial [Burkholderiales bacterium]